MNSDSNHKEIGQELKGILLNILINATTKTHLYVVVASYRGVVTPRRVLAVWGAGIFKIIRK